ncbi:hypothetical protein OS493_003974 [Desmophyllum pertusum]|uniref:Uncharacterized protein n=1 Tax=Desmophyllum pertusum TaxID=174260 RepID=A0A9X0D5A3_9CNID|nr:hypothetical protein OS493_003974 [Desmophyllum pertusum]
MLSVTRSLFVVFSEVTVPRYKADVPRYKAAARRFQTVPLLPSPAIGYQERRSCTDYCCLACDSEYEWYKLEGKALALRQSEMSVDKPVFPGKTKLEWCLETSLLAQPEMHILDPGPPDCSKTRPIAVIVERNANFLGGESEVRHDTRAEKNSTDHRGDYEKRKNS